MPREPAISPSGNALRRNKNRRSKTWPAATGFCEESAPAPNPQYFQVVARRIAEQVAASEWPVYVQAVAGEAVNRLLRLGRVATASRKLLVEYHHRYEVIPDESSLWNADECRVHLVTTNGCLGLMEPAAQERLTTVLLGNFGLGPVINSKLVSAQNAAS